MPYIGEIAALTAAFFWGFCAMLFEKAGKEIGAFPTNLLRIFFACILLSLTLFFQQGLFYPVEASANSSFWLGLSGLIGLAIGDGALFFSIVILGPRLATLLLSLAPPFATVVAWFFIGERLGIQALLGIVLTIAAIMWVVGEKDDKTPINGSKTVGVLLGLLGAAGQGIGVIFAKMGIVPELDSLSATMLRMVPACLGLWIAAVLIKQAGPTIRALKNRTGLLATIGGSIFGPYIGVWLSIVAVKYTEAGIAATLLATVPILIIPLDIAVHKRRPSWRAVAGTLVAVAGIALIFLR